jgi:hypothetical protein
VRVERLAAPSGEARLQGPNQIVVLGSREREPEIDGGGDDFVLALHLEAVEQVRARRHGAQKGEQILTAHRCPQSCALIKA